VLRAGVRASGRRVCGGKAGLRQICELAHFDAEVSSRVGHVRARAFAQSTEDPTKFVAVCW